MELLAKNLRIGNWIKWLHEESESFHQVNIDFLKNQLDYENDPDDDQFARGWWSAPIPLTEEWLLKFGFEDESYKDGYIGIEFTSNMTLDFVLTKPKFMGEWQKTYHYELGQHRIVSVGYVHELQNLFFALTSQELEIKEFANV